MFDARVQFGTELDGRGLGVIIDFPAKPGPQGGMSAAEPLGLATSRDSPRTRLKISLTASA